jgi:hypothetical protein
MTPGCASEYPGVASGTTHNKRVVLLLKSKIAMGSTCCASPRTLPVWGAEGPGAGMSRGGAKDEDGLGGLLTSLTSWQKDASANFESFSSLVCMPGNERHVAAARGTQDPGGEGSRAGTYNTSRRASGLSDNSPWLGSTTVAVQIPGRALGTHSDLSGAATLSRNSPKHQGALSQSESRRGSVHSSVARARSMSFGKQVLPEIAL